MNLSIRELNELIYSLGITAHHGMFCQKDLNKSLLDKLYDELSRKILAEVIEEVDANFLAEQYDIERDILKDSNSHIVSNEEADEDYRSTLKQDEQRYGDSHMLASFPIVDPFTSKRPTKERGWIVQAMLDYVDAMGTRTHGQMENYYKFITNGSNSFSHCLINLKVPYKNRKTQRYLAKEGRRGSNAKWVVKSSNIHNWVVNEY